ncbi:hypothetical protein RvY_06728 [Ramazzottius varieornatus]|uniref:Uncharacterized protein n=1 Tax=Ramazzottius varieornatus TaxID=947166 RepID=A0A1D1V5U6_RAMVA|nr:hypothetical protein RvY_06728 [Ramazzottius varieornatus]
MSDYWVLPTLQQQAVPVASGLTTSTKKSTVSKRYGCCIKECLLQLPPELVKQTKDYFAHFSPGDKNMFLLGKVTASLDLDHPESELTGKAGRGTPTYYHLDKNIRVCRIAFESIFSLTPKQMRTIRQHLIDQREGPVPALNADGLPYQKPLGPAAKPIPQGPPPPPPDTHDETVHEMILVDYKILSLCCEKHCWSKIPSALIALTIVQMGHLTEHEREMYLLGKMSCSMSLVPATTVSAGGLRARYVVDRDTTVCTICFQYMHNLNDEQIRKLRFSLFEIGSALELPVDEKSKKRTSVSNDSVTEIDPAADSERPAKKTRKPRDDLECCNKHCLKKIPSDVVRAIRTQTRQLSSKDRHMFLLGKLSGSVSLVNAANCEHTAEKAKPFLKKKKLQLARKTKYKLDKDNFVCLKAFHSLYSAGKNQLDMLKDHFMAHGIERLVHRQTGLPGNAKGKKHKRKDSGTGDGNEGTFVTVLPADETDDDSRHQSFTEANSSILHCL